MDFALSYYIYFIMFVYNIEAYSFLVGDRIGVDPEGREGGKELGGVEEGEILIRIYSMEKASNCQ